MSRLLTEQDTETLKSITAASVLRGVVYGEENARAWAGLSNTKIRIWLGDYFKTLGLVLVVDEAEQFAYLRSSPELPEGMPRLVRRHQLTFRMSVLLALLRERLDESARDGATERAVLTHEQLVELMRPYHGADTTDDKISLDIGTAVAGDYLRKLPGTDPVSYEVRRHVRSLVAADWLEQFADRLHRAAAAKSSDPHDPGNNDEPTCADPASHSATEER